SSEIGVPYGLARLDAETFTSANPNWSRIMAASARADNAPVDIISAAHVALARAEAAHLGWTTESAETMYNNGITLSHEQWGVSVPAGYLSSSAVALGGADDFRKISLQRYIASY